MRKSVLVTQNGFGENLALIYLDSGIAQELKDTGFNLSLAIKIYLIIIGVLVWC